MMARRGLLALLLAVGFATNACAAPKPGPALHCRHPLTTIGSAAGLYGFLQMAVGAACTTLAGLGHDPAVAACTVLVGAALMAQISFRVARRTPANDVVERENANA